MFKQMPEYFESFFFSKYQCGFRKGFSAQHYLVSILEQWKSATDNKKAFGALLTDLSNTVDCLSHDLLIAKLNTYGFNMSALRFVHSYLKNPMQRTRKNSDHSSWEEIMFCVLQGSILGPQLFNIFLCDPFFVMENIDIASYADDNTPYTSVNSRCNFSLVVRYSLKFTRCSLLILKSLVARYKICSLLVEEVARCKKSLVTRCRNC